MDDAKAAAKIEDPDENDHGEVPESETNFASRGFPTEDYTTPSEARQGKDAASQDQNTITEPSPNTTNTPSGVPNDINTTGNMAGDATEAKKDATMNSKDPPLETDKPVLPTEVKAQEKSSTKEVMDVATGERDTIDKPPAKPLTETFAIPSQIQPKASSSEVPRSQHLPFEMTKKVEETKESYTKQSTQPMDAAKESKQSTPSGSKPTAPAAVPNLQDTKPSTAATHSSLTANNAGPPAAASSPGSAESKVGEGGDIDPFDAVQIAIRKERTPLTDLYEPYIAPCDTSLADARNRLVTALQQTRRLQKAFTDRVYQKYRICLRPPPTLETTLQRIRSDPAASVKRLQEEQEQIRVEKEMEKKESSFLNAELRRQSSAPADQADQLMFMTAGLNLVMLHDDPSIDPECWKPYSDGRGPTNEFGQRNKSISAAAATAGELIIERTRKASALRVERQRRRQLQLLSGESSRTTRPAVLAPAGISTILQGKTAPASAPAAPPTNETQSKKHEPLKVAPAPKAASTTGAGPKSGRNRTVSSALTASNLLSLHYSADQIDVMNHLASRAVAPATSHHHHQVKIAASTSALMSKGVGAATPKMMSTQLRLRHPHPESLGGQRRANTWTSSSTPSGSSVATAPRQQQPFSEAFLKQTLPPLPTVRDRLERKPLKVMPSLEAATSRAKDAVKKVVQPFGKPSFSADGPKLGDVTKIRVLHNLWKLGNEVPLFEEFDTETVGSAKPVSLSDEPETDSALDPVVAFMVLHSVGLIGRSRRSKDFRKFEDLLPQLDSDTGSERLETIRRRILQNTQESFTDGLFSGKRKRDAGDKDQGSTKKPKTSEDPQLTNVKGNLALESFSNEERSGETDLDGIPIMSIRGGGEAVKEAEAPTPKSDENRSGASGTEEQPSVPSRPPPQGDSTASPGRSPTRQPHPAIQAQPMESNPVQYVAVSGGSINPNLPGYLTPPERFHHSSAMNSLHLAHQLRQGTFQHPAGDIASGSLPYLGQHHPHEGFDLSSFVGPGGLQNAHSSLTALNYARQNQAVAEARAQLYAREQQAAALLRGAAFSQHGHSYGPVGAPHPAAFAALLGNSNHSALLNNGQYSIALGGHVGGMHQSMYQPTMVHLEAAQAPNVSSHAQSETQGTNRAKIRSNGGKEQASVESPSRSKKRNTDNPRSRSTSIDTSDRQDKTKKNAPAAKTAQEKKEQQTSAPIEKTLEKTNPTLQAKATPSEGASKESSKGASKETDRNEAERTKSAVINLQTAKSQTTQADPTVAKPQHKEKGVAENENTKHPSMEKAKEKAPEAREPKAPPKTDDGMRFVAPPSPPCITRADAENIRDGRFHEIAEHYTDPKISQEALKYLVGCGSAIPIPRALVMAPLRERLNTPGFKASSANGLPTIPREVVAYTILVWLWANHEIAFRDAFEKSGRIDVDPDCKWLIHAAVDTSIRELTSEIAQERATNKGPFAAPAGPSEDVDKSGVSIKLDIHTAKIVSKSLMTELRVLEESNLATPNFQSLVGYLDEARMCALRGKSKERALLAGLLSRRTNILESFSHAYTSSMVRAGEACGHENLLEVVQDESVYVSSMLPYDICSDDMGEWEDPCRPDTGFMTESPAIELKRRAHARAMIQKSLKKLQDRHGVKGGVTNQGPLSDQPSDEANSASRTPSAPTPRAGYKRKWATFSEPPPPPGTGSAAALSWAAYDPRHFSAPLEWDPHELENLPYGQHDSHERPRSVSLSLSARTDPRSGKKVKRSMSMSSQTFSESVGDMDGDMDGLQRGTCEIPWVEVAGIFQRLELPKKSPPKASSHHDHHASVPVPAGSVIVAPFCRQLDRELSDKEDESDTEEDLTDEYVISQHEAVLDDMKQKLSAYMEAKQKQNDRKRGRPSRAK